MTTTSIKKMLLQTTLKKSNYEKETYNQAHNINRD
jgi:hypothetical protein